MPSLWEIWRKEAGFIESSYINLGKMWKSLLQKPTLIYSALSWPTNGMGVGSCYWRLFCILLPDPKPNMSLISGHVTCPGNVYNVVYFETKRKLYLYSAPLTPPTNTHNYSDWSKFDQCHATWHDFIWWPHCILSLGYFVGVARFKLSWCLPFNL